MIDKICEELDINLDELFIKQLLKKQLELEQENQELKEENFNLREYINIDKMFAPYKSDSFEELMTMPTYKKLEQKLDLYKSVLDEIREYINTLLNDANSKESDLYIYEQNKAIMEYILQILDKEKK